MFLRWTGNIYVHLYMCVVFSWSEILSEKKGNYRLIRYKIIWIWKGKVVVNLKDIFYFADSFVYFPNTSLWGESCLSAPADRLSDEWDIDIAKRCRTFSGRAARMSTERLLGTYASLMAVGMSIFLHRKIQTRALLSHLNTVHPQPQKIWNFAKLFIYFRQILGIVGPKDYVFKLADAF